MDLKSTLEERKKGQRVKAQGNWQEAAGGSQKSKNQFDLATMAL